MFVLAIVEDKVKILPDSFSKPPLDALIEQIELKFVNKIILDVGLCISFYDFIEICDPYIYPAEGSSHQNIKFRLVMFRPYIGEIIVGNIHSCNAEEIKVTLGFFENITIPSYLLQANSEFRSYPNNCWVWKYSQDELDSEFFLNPGDQIRFKIRAIDFTRLTTTSTGLIATVSSEQKEAESDKNKFSSESGINDDLKIRKRSTSFDITKDDDKPPPMNIIGSINEDGLGLTSWW